MSFIYCHLNFHANLLRPWCFPLPFFSETTEPIWTKLDRNVHYKVSYKVDVFLMIRSTIHKRNKRPKGVKKGVSIYMDINYLFVFVGDFFLFWYKKCPKKFLFLNFYPILMQFFHIVHFYELLMERKILFTILFRKRGIKWHLHIWKVYNFFYLPSNFYVFLFFLNIFCWDLSVVCWQVSSYLLLFPR
jgi:hypothetical protein